MLSITQVSWDPVAILLHQTIPVGWQRDRFRHPATHPGDQSEPRARPAGNDNAYALGTTQQSRASGWRRRSAPLELGDNALCGPAGLGQRLGVRRADQQRQLPPLRSKTVFDCLQNAAVV